MSSIYETIKLRQKVVCTLFAAVSLTVFHVHAVEVEDRLMQQLRADETTGYAIFFRERADLSPAYAMDWQDRGRFVVDALQATADASQGRVRAWLDDSGTAYRTFWIDNVIVVETSNRSTFDGLQQFDEIAALRADPEMQWIEPEETTVDASPAAVRPAGDGQPEPSIAHVKAPDVWALGVEGQGMTVASIDSGVRFTHETLVGRYRGNLGDGNFDHNHHWWNPGDNNPAPVDFVGHGTHTMGTMVGNDGVANRIGIAPGAQWVMCGITGALFPEYLLECAEFLAAPWNLDQDDPDPDLRPHVVNNSWGNCQQFYDPWFQGVIDTWHALGIMPVFANGNTASCGTGPVCNTVSNPARYGNVVGVGSTGTSNSQYAFHSLRGPTDDPWNDNPLGFPAIKPNVVAPGVQIRSALSESDDAYGLGTGTSMSAPHVAGMVALLWQAADCLVGDYEGTVEILMANASDIPFSSQCGGEGPDNVPNNATGWGEIDALAIVHAGLEACGVGIEGHVTRADTTEALEGVLVEATGPATFSSSSEIDGAYRVAVLSNTYDVTVSKAGFISQTVAGVAVPEGESVTVDFVLDPAPIAAWSPGGLWFQVPPGGAASDTVGIGNTGHADMIWNIVTDVPVALAGVAGIDPDLDETIQIPDFEVVSPAHDGAAVTFTIAAGLTTRGRVTGFSFAGTATGVSGTQSWASDTCMILQSPNGAMYGAGGLEGLLPECNANDWDFSGTASAADGSYESRHDDIFEPAAADLGEWTFTFVNDWDSPPAASIAWTDVSVTLHKAPLQACGSTADIPWLDVTPADGVTPPNVNHEITVAVDSTGLAPGLHEATLCVITNDPEREVIMVPVTLTVQGPTEPPLDPVFQDRFETAKGL